MASADGSEDVNDFLQRIKELGDRRDQEDEERNRKLEEEILQGRKERQARRAERARSISPTKSSPSSTPTASRISTAQASSLSQSNTPTMQPRAESEPREAAIDDAMARLTGSTTKENTTPFEAGRVSTDSDLDRGTPMKNSPSNAMPSRTPTLSWQQRRPNSQASDRPRNRPLSVIATENAARSPRETPEPSNATEETMSRDQIAQSLASKDPAWFRQTADRGLNSPAYRRNQVEDEDRAEHGSLSARIEMPGMSQSLSQPEKAEEPIDRSSSPTRSSRLYGRESRNSGNIAGLGSPMSLNSAQKLDPPEEIKPDTRALAMSPSQGRISPERLERAPSPTKGMGGFVQSAMMKRSDSVSKRWSVQSPPGLNRGNSVASNRSNQDIGSILAGDRSRDSSHEPTSRPSSSHSNATITQDRPGTSSSMRSTMTSSTTDEVFVKPTLPASRSRSPTKASWLESALNKPDSPKPKATPPPQQPSWMAEINKAKKKSVDLGQSQSAPPIHDVKVGGLLRSPPLGGISKPSVIGGLPAGFSPGFISSRPESRISQSAPSPLPIKSPSNGAPKIKPETPPKKDFRAGLKSRQTPAEGKGSEEPEFKNVFGQLKRTKTQNYVAPDTLKDNITRGKNSLSVTGGPVKTERKDEFREAILKKKDDFRAAQAEGKGVTRAASGERQEKSVPEALLKRQEMGRSGSVTAADKSPEVEPRQRIAQGSPTPTLLKETSAPGRLQGKDAIGAKLAGRFNPALADLLARGPPSAACETSHSSSPAKSNRAINNSTAINSKIDRPESGPQLIHMTKGRVRGPRRKAPSAAPTSSPFPSPITVEKNFDAPSQQQEKLAKSATTKPQPSPKPSFVPKPTSTTEVESPIQPSSPRKLDMKRRSQFLQDVVSKTEPLSPRPLSLTKQDNGMATPAKPQDTTTEPKVKPETPVKSPTLKYRGSPKPDSEFKDAPTKLTGPSSPSLNVAPPLTKYSREAITIEEPTKSQSKIDRSEPSVSVRGAAATWSAKTPEAPARMKSPIKLPTHADEKAALVEAGLRSPSPEKPRPGIGLGIQPSGVRPFPIPPTKSVISPPPSAGLPSSPKKSMASPPPPASEATHFLLDFFGAKSSPPDYTADTATILASRPDQESSIKTLRSSLFQLSPDGKKQPVPSHQERMLFEGNLYICTHMYGNADGKEVSEVYYWIGDNVSEQIAKEAKIFANREAKNAGGELVVITQGKETPAFFAALGGIIIVRRGSSSKYDSLAPHILCGRKHFGHIAFDEVDFSASTLCSGFAYLISTQSGKIYLWRGKGVHADELSCARLIGMDFGITGDIEEVEDGNEPESFIKIFGEGARIPKSADHWRLKPNYNTYCGRLFLAGEGKEQITEIFPYRQADLSPQNIYILDAFFEIYIITGHKAQSQYDAFHHALTFAQEYGILAAGMEDRPRVPFTTVVMEGVPKDMKSLFRKWTDVLSPTVTHNTGLQRGRSLRVVGLNAALEALRG